MLPKILGEWWRIETTEDARKELDYLCQKDTGIIFPLSTKHSCWTNRKNKMKSFSRT